MQMFCPVSRLRSALTATALVQSPSAADCRRRAGSSRAPSSAPRRPGRRAADGASSAGQSRCRRYGREGGATAPSSRRHRPERSACRASPSCFQLRISKVSSRVPMPPGRTAKASARSAISALRACIVSTTTSSLTPGWASSASRSRAGMMPVTRPPRAKRGIGRAAPSARPARRQTPARCRLRRAARRARSPRRGKRSSTAPEEPQ